MQGVGPWFPWSLISFDETNTNFVILCHLMHVFILFLFSDDADGQKPVVKLWSTGLKDNILKFKNLLVIIFDMFVICI